MSDDRRDYYRQRAEAASSLAAQATDERVRAAHEEMAARYAHLAAGRNPDPTVDDDEDDD